jgi:biotin carboxylase
MRVRARDVGLPIPDFVPLFHDDDIRRFLQRVPPPWLMKPRSQASSIGIHTLHSADEVWKRLAELGDEASFHLLEQFIPSDLYHADSLVNNRRVLFCEVGRYHRPLLDVYHGGGVFATRTAPRNAPEVQRIRELNARVLSTFGMEWGCSHTEFLRSRADDTLYFLETSARVGGACISEMVEAATGLNLWEEWARLEVLGGHYQLPPLRHEYGGATVSLARTEQPDTSSFDDPEIFYRMDKKHHVGLVVRSPRPERVEELLDRYITRIVRDYQAVLPPASKATA